MKGFRTVQPPLSFASRCTRPAFLPQSRPRGAKAQGLRFERGLAKLLVTVAVHGPWFEFEDSRGRGWCQPDFILPRKDLGAAFIIEAKLSWVPEAEKKLRGLYLPVVAKALKCKTYGIVLCKSLKSETPRDLVINDPDEALRAALGGDIPVLLWGDHAKVWAQSALVPRPRRAA